ncbi:MAG TPA: hypothetical protein VL856_13310 [Acidimicrobiia bacterium]|jgi:hypothetical protein|nr:hypothetical protein [Acidimicrobiia bacterium]
MRSHVFHRSAALLAVPALAIGVAACSDTSASSKNTADRRPATQEIRSDAPPAHVVRFTARDYAFSGPKQIPAGRTKLVLTNRGDVEHQLGLFKLNPGDTTGTAFAAISKAGNLEGGRTHGTWLGGPNGVAPHTAVSVIVDLAPGKYVVGCLMPAADGQPHATKGMLSELTVTGTAARASTADDQLPRVSLHEYFIELPADFGKQSVEVVNEGKEVHELVIARMKGDATVNDIVAYEKLPFPRTKPSPDEDVAGSTFLNPGERTRLDLDLAPGRYVALCYLPAPDGKAHILHGMGHPFTVS